MTRALRCAAILLAALIAVSACGKKGDPIPPSGEDSTFPEVFPQR